MFACDFFLKKEIAFCLCWMCIILSMRSRSCRYYAYVHVLDLFLHLNWSKKTNSVPQTSWHRGIRNKLSKAIVVRQTDLSGKVNANWHPLSRLHIPEDSVTTDRWWQNREVGCSRGVQGVPQTLGKKNERSHCADSPIPQSGPLATTEFLHR